METPLFVVDAFTEAPFSGNPAAVCIPSAPKSEEWMRAVAREMNLSETAFLRPIGEEWELRWFTPALEVDLCGHATLACAHVLWSEGRLASEKAATFRTRSGILAARRDGERIELDFPLVVPKETPAPPELGAALGARVRKCARAGPYLLAEVEGESALRELRPDLRILSQIPVTGIAVTAASDAPGFDYVCRFFAPAAGIPEDPVTGSAQCSLGPYWAARLGKSDLRAFQASARGGSIRVRLAGDRVHLGGRAVTVVRGALTA